MNSSAQVIADSIDVDGFARALRELRAEVDSQLGEPDFAHLRKLERWSRGCTIAGYATAWLAPNPISALLISLGNVSRWTILTHHISHRSMDRIAGVPARYTSRHYAVGIRRLIDWMDWILPEAWHEEHNLLHHYHTGEIEDPDLVEENSRSVRDARIPVALKYAVVAFYACTWKLSYYAPNTFQHLLAAQRRRSGAPQAEPKHYVESFNPLTAEGRQFWRRCVLPYGLFRFALIPSLFLPLGPLAAGSVFLNSLLAELFANLHSFLIIAPNHAGDDLYRFEGHCRDRGEFFLRQVTGSVNFRGGTELLDFLQGYLNYQIEHHLFPDLPPLRYRQIKPKVQSLCARFGIPYVEQGVFSRLKQLASIMVGKTSMKRPPIERLRVSAG